MRPHLPIKKKKRLPTTALDPATLRAVIAQVERQRAAQSVRRGTPGAGAPQVGDQSPAEHMARSTSYDRQPGQSSTA